MASAEGFLQSPLVVWVRFSLWSHCVRNTVDHCLQTLLMNWLNTRSRGCISLIIFSSLQANNTFKASALIESVTDLADGIFLNEIMMDM